MARELRGSAQGRRPASGAAASRIVLGTVLVALIGSLLPLGTALAAPAARTTDASPPQLINPSSILTLSVRALNDDNSLGTPITDYQWLISVDDSGTPTQDRDDCFPATNPQYPEGCDWPSVHTFTGGAGGTDNILTWGDQDDLGTTASIDLTAHPGRYLISVMADDHKLGGEWFTIPLEEPAPGQAAITVGLQQDPLPLSTVRIQVFEDTIVNGQYDQSEHGLAGFKGHIEDVVGEISTDWFGNPICGEYDGVPAGDNYIPGTGGECLSDEDGLIVIPNLGSNRFAATVVPPAGTDWIQTSSLEGGLDWDIWAYEGYQGLLRELIVQGDNVPASWFGFVRPADEFTDPGDTGSISGQVLSTKSYLPPAGGDTTEGPVSDAYVAITDLGVADQELVYVGSAGPDGTFDIGNVPDSTYQVAMWDFQQDLLLGFTTVIVDGGNPVSIGQFALPHWFSGLDGYVYVDTNENGEFDSGEQPIVGQVLVLKQRDNSLVDQFSAAATTDIHGYYRFQQVYPYGFWTVLENYNDLFYTVDVTYRADVAPPVTRYGAGVDVSMFNMDGIPNHVDWGVKPYAPNTNGGIVGSVVYNMTRNELDARMAATEDYEPGIPGMTVNLWAPIACPEDAGAENCTANGEWLLAADGSVAKGTLLNTYTTEEFVRPTNCQYRDAHGNPLDHLPFMSPPDDDRECIESPLMGAQVKTGPSESDTGESEFTLVNGNYGFGDGCFDTGFNLGTGACNDGGEPEALVPGDYLVEVVSPMDDVFGDRAKFKVSREEDINVFGGDQFEPAVLPHACAGAMHPVDVAGIDDDGDLEFLADGTTPNPLFDGDGSNATVNPSFVEVGGSPFEGVDKPLCDVRLVTLGDRRSTAPGFSFFTDVPVPGRLFGAIVEDLQLGTDPNEFYYGEKAGVPNAPIGIYDYTGRLLHTIQSDPNGYFEVLLPSTRTFNCPLPAGPCPNVYRLVGNDPGQPDRPNAAYDPQYRSMETDWQIWPGLTLLADIALIPTSPVIEFPGVQGTHPPDCNVEAGRPQLFRVSRPYGEVGDAFTIEGQGFGGTQGHVSLDGTDLVVGEWTDRHLAVTIPATIGAGPHQLLITAAGGLASVNALTFHVLGLTYAPNIVEVGQGKPYSSIQGAIEFAASHAGNDLVVVWPSAAGSFTPLGDYYENVVIHSPIKLQGVGPGGVRADGTFEKGSIINGIGFATIREQAWDEFVDGLKISDPWDGDQTVYEGAGIYVVADDTEFTDGFNASIDGLGIRGADALLAPEFNGRLITFNPIQAGGIFVNAYARHLGITNNVISGNGGAYAGAIRIGTPYEDGHNDDIRIANNRIVGNGGTNLAGAIGLFSGANGYEIAGNDICGNFSAEYGGGISQFGLSSQPSSIHHNRIWFNGSYDEGGGIMIGGELPDAGILSPGAGPVDIYANVIQANLANDDGGGLRFLMAGHFPINVYNNFIVNNVSTHEGGGVALDDTTDVRFYNNTVARNLTTATGVDAQVDPATGNTLPDPAGLSDTGNSDLLQATLPAGHEPFSDPVLFNNIFWDNRSGHFDAAGNKVVGLGLHPSGTDDDIDNWDLSVVGPGLLEPTSSVLQTTRGTVLDASNQVGVDPELNAIYDLQISTLAWRAGGTPNQFIFVHLITDDAPPGELGDYHLTAFSPARNAASPLTLGIHAPLTDIDDDVRPIGGFDIGADEETTPEVDLVGPLVSSLAVTPSPANTNSVTLAGHADDSLTGLSTIAAAEWFDAAAPDPGSGSANPIGAEDGAFDEVAEDLEATIDTSAWSEGTYTLRVRASDAAGNWGATESITFTIDRSGPAVSGLTLTPNRSTSSGGVVIGGAASDGATGGLNVVAAEFYVDGTGGTATALSVGSPAVTVLLSGTLAAGLGNGSHTIHVRAQDAAGNWGPFGVVTLIVDLVGPATSGLAVSPNPTAGVAFVNLTGLASDIASGGADIAGAEWYVDGASAATTPVAAFDGAFNSPSESLSTAIDVSGWSVGSHTVSVRSIDALGNWGPVSTIGVTISAAPPGDVQGPVTNEAATEPTTVGGARAVIVKAKASDATTGGSTISESEWFEGVDPGLGNGHSIAAADGTFDEVEEQVRSTFLTTGWSVGPHILRIRSRDAAGNWGATTSATVVITPTAAIVPVLAPFAVDDFSQRNLAAWSGVVGSADVGIRAAASLDGSAGLAVRLHPGVVAYLVDSSPNRVNQYHARFKFHPHGAVTGTGRQTLLRGRSATGATLFQLEYRHASRGSYQVRLLVRRTSGLVGGPWVTIGNRSTTIEVAWYGRGAGGAYLYVNRRLASRVLGNTSPYRLDQVRLGLVTTLARASGTEYIDGFVSSRTTHVGS